MSSLPWEPDRRLTIDLARSVIRAVFPNVDADQLCFSGSGWEFDVFVTTDGWAFRFPRRQEYEGLFERERPAISLARDALPTGTLVPQVELVGTPSQDFPYTFAGHRFIKGVSADSVHTRLHSELTRSVGTVLGAIHTVPVVVARAAGVSEMEAPDDGAYEWFRRNLSGASQLVVSEPTVHDAVAWVSALADPLRARAAPVRFIHHDLSPEHLVVDPSTGRLAGILDWTDAGLGDPASDFVTCATFGGWTFVERVTRHYSGAVDRSFWERLRYMAQLLSVMWLGEACKNGGDVAKHVAWVKNAFTLQSAS